MKYKVKGIPKEKQYEEWQGCVPTLTTISNICDSIDKAKIWANENLDCNYTVYYIPILE